MPEENTLTEEDKLIDDLVFFLEEKETNKTYPVDLIRKMIDHIMEFE